MLEHMAPALNWAYITPGQDKADPLLSPICATRDMLPQRIYFIGAEYDYLCHEAEIMARSLAFGKFEVPGDQVGELGMQWEREGIKWWNVAGAVHGWTHIPMKGDENVVKQNMLKRLKREIAEFVASE